MSNNENKPQSKPQNRTKAGRTLLVKPSSSNFSASIFDDFSGITSKHHIEKTDSYFLTFTSAKEALEALKKLKGTKNARVKFAQYRIFFKMEGLVDSTDYNAVKLAHTEIVKKLGGDVLYYRLYRKDNKFLGCGDMTIDTKDVFDKLISAGDDNTGLKQFKLDGITGTHFRYKKTDNNQNEAN
jgi:hypothetical protein